MHNCWGAKIYKKVKWKTNYCFAKGYLRKASGSRKQHQGSMYICSAMGFFLRFFVLSLWFCNLFYSGEWILLGNSLQTVRHNDYNRDQLVHQEFGIQVMPELTSIDARVLPPPMVIILFYALMNGMIFNLAFNFCSVLVVQIKYNETGKESRVDPRVGQWNMINKVGMSYLCIIMIYYLHMVLECLWLLCCENACGVSIFGDWFNVVDCIFLLLKS